VYYPPSQPGWSGRFKATDGSYYGVKEEMAGEIPLGVPTEVEITTKEKDGKIYRDIKRVIGFPSKAGGGSTAPAPRAGSYDDATSERIFVCGALNAVLPKIFERDSGLLPSKLVEVVEMLRATWRNTFGRKHDDTAA
jgi:hypothetical protein